MARYRDLVGPTPVQTNFGSTGADDFSAALAGAARAATSLGVEIGGALRAQEGAAQGEADAAAGKPQPKSGFAALTRFGQAYNSAAEATYSANLQVDVATTRDRLEREFEGNPEGFKAAFDGYYRGLTEEAPQAYRSRIDLLAKANYAAGLGKLQEQEQAQEAANTRAGLIEGGPALLKSTLDALRTGAYPREQEDALIAAAVTEYGALLDAAGTAIGPEDAAKMRLAFADALDKGLVDQRVTSVAERLQATVKVDAVEAERQLADVLADPSITEVEKDAIQQQFEADARADYYLKSRLYSEDVARLAVRQTNGESGPGLVAEGRRLRKLNAISPDAYEGVLVRNAANAKAQEAATATAQSYDWPAVVAAGGGNPGDTQYRKAVDEKFAVEMAQIPVGSPMFQEQALMAVRQLNVLPKAAENWAVASLMQGAPPEQQALAALFLQRVSNLNPVAWDYNKDPRVSAFADQLATAVQTGMEPAVASQIVTDAVYKVAPDRQKYLDETYRRDKVFETNPNALRTLMDDIEGDRFDASNWIGGIPDTPPAMQTEFNSLVKSYYPLYGGKVAEARQAAWKAVRNTWGVTRVNGKPQIVKYPPEMQGLDPTTVRADIDSVLTQVGFRGDKAQVQLVEDFETAATNGKRWALEYVDEDGARNVVLGPDNRPVRYDLPVSQHAREEVLRVATAAKKEEARVMRADRDARRKILEEGVGSFNSMDPTR